MRSPMGKADGYPKSCCFSILCCSKVGVKKKKGKKKLDPLFDTIEEEESRWAVKGLVVQHFEKIH